MGIPADGNHECTFLLGRSQLCFPAKGKIKLIPPLKSCKMAESNRFAHMPGESGKPTACGSKFTRAVWCFSCRYVKWSMSSSTKYKQQSPSPQQNNDLAAAHQSDRSKSCRILRIYAMGIFSRINHNRVPWLFSTLVWQYSKAVELFSTLLTLIVAKGNRSWMGHGTICPNYIQCWNGFIT